MLVFGLIAALTLGPVPAETPGATEVLALRWHAPAGCPDEEQAQGLVERLMPAHAAKVRATVTIDAIAGEFEGSLDLQVESSRTTRSFRVEDCMVLTSAIAVVIAVSLDPVAVAGDARTAAVPEPEPVASATVGPTPSRLPSIESSPQRGAVPRNTDAAGSRALRGGLEAGARLGAGIDGLLLPAAGVGLSLAPFVGTSRLHVMAVAQYWAPRRIALDPSRDAHGELQLVTAGVRVCPQLGGRSVRFPLCAGADVGAILGRGTGRDLAIPRSARGPWAGAVLESGVVMSVTSRVSVWIALEGVVSLYRPRFAIEGAARTFTAGAGALRGLMGVQVHAPRKRPQNP